MKRLGAILILSLLFILPIVLAATEEQQVLAQTGIPGIENIDPTKIPTSTDELKDTATDYLKNEWKKVIFENKIFGPIFKFTDALLTSINPFFRIVLGMEYSFSWAFTFAIAIWIILFLIIFPVTQALTNNKTIISILASFAIVSLIGVSGTIKKAVSLLSTIINNGWIAWISVIIVIVIFLVAILFGRYFKKYIEAMKAAEALEKEKQDRQVLSTTAEIQKERINNAKKS